MNTVAVLGGGPAGAMAAIEARLTAAGKHGASDYFQRRALGLTPPRNVGAEPDSSARLGRLAVRVTWETSYAGAVPIERYDVLMVLDCSNPKRLGWEGVERAAPFIVNIDHHRDNVNFGNLNIVRPEAAATGQIIYDFFMHSNIDLPPSVAEALYTAILTDTGGFRFSNTSAAVLAICADLSNRGARGSKIYEQVYASFSPAGLQLQARIWSTLSFHHNNTICSMEMPYSLIDELGASYGDSEGMADCTIMASGVEVGMLIKYSPTQTHFSLRSTGRLDVGKIAKAIEGGGGHSSAAGCTMSRPFPEAKKAMLQILSQELG